MYDWDAARQEACQLYYDQGLSLTALKVELGKRKRDVSEAHDRTWRLKLKEWGAKRPRVTTVASSRQPDGSSLARQDVGDEQDGLHPGGDAMPTLTLGDTATVAWCDQAMHALADATTPIPTVRASSMAAIHARMDLSYACLCCAAELEGAARELFDLLHSGYDNIPDNLLERCVRGPDTDNILHLLARDSRWASLKQTRHMITLALDPPHGLQVDALDCDGMTALELSIRSNNCAVMELLIKHGASLSRWNSNGQTPLAVALNKSRKVQTIATLLDRIKEAELRLDDIDHTAEAFLSDGTLREFREILREGKLSQVEIMWPVVDYVVFGSNRWQLSRDDVRRLLMLILEGFKHGEQQGWYETERRAVVCKLFEYWVGSWDDLDDYFFGGCDCHSVAEFCIFHLADSDINETVLDRATTPLRLAHSLVMPCRLRAATCDVNYLVNMLERTTPRWEDVDIEDKYSLLQGIMRYTPKDLRLPYWKVVVNSNALDIHCCYTNETLVDTLIDHKSCFDIAEVLLPHDGGFPGSLGVLSQFFSPDESIEYSYYSSDAYLHHLYHCMAIDYDDQVGEMWYSRWTDSPLQPCGCNSRVTVTSLDGQCSSEAGSQENGSPEIDSREYDHVFDKAIEERAQTMQRYVIHVITKDLCRAESLFAPDEALKTRVGNALKLRKRFELPELAVELEVLLQMLDGCGINK